MTLIFLRCLHFIRVRFKGKILSSKIFKTDITVYIIIYTSSKSKMYTVANITTHLKLCKTNINSTKIQDLYLIYDFKLPKALLYQVSYKLADIFKFLSPY